MGLLLGALWVAGLSTTERATAAERVHEVAPGQTLWGIAHRYQVTVAAVRAKNGLVDDKIRPGQRLIIPPKGWQPGASPGKQASGKPPSWTQVQKSPAERGGINPCLTPDPGFGVYGHWQRGIGIGQLLIPERGGLTPSGGFDLMIHFHGHEAVRKEWVHVMNGAVLAAVDLGTGSGVYFDTFSSPAAFKQLIKNIEDAVARQHGRKSTHVRKLGLRSWSAGYGAIQQILSQPAGKNVDSVVLLDGLHCGYVGKALNGKQIQPFLDYAKLAARGRKFMFVSHSSIIPPGYSSTTETANLLIRTVGGRPRRTHSRRGDPMGLDLISRYSRGSFHVRGYSGNDKMDHCAHIGLYRDVLKVHIKRRWNSPRGYRKGKTGS